MFLSWPERTVRWKKRRLCVRISKNINVLVLTWMLLSYYDCHDLTDKGGGGPRLNSKHLQHIEFDEIKNRKQSRGDLIPGSAPRAHAGFFTCGGSCGRAVDPHHCRGWLFPSCWAGHVCSDGDFWAAAVFVYLQLEKTYFLRWYLWNWIFFWNTVRLAQPCRMLPLLHFCPVFMAIIHNRQNYE